MLRRWLARLRRAAALSRAERRELARAQAALLAAQLRVWTRPAGRLVRLGPLTADAPGTTGPGGAYAGVPPGGEPGGADSTSGRPSARPTAHADALARAVDRAARAGLFRPACLVRALALHRLLGRAGVGGGRIRIGVRTEGPRLRAHAWVEVDGAALGEDGRRAGGFLPLPGEARP
jgi:hypothetical protein